MNKKNILAVTSSFALILSSGVFFLNTDYYKGIEKEKEIENNINKFSNDRLILTENSYTTLNKIILIHQSYNNENGLSLEIDKIPFENETFQKKEFLFEKKIQKTIKEHFSTQKEVKISQKLFSYRYGQKSFVNNLQLKIESKNKKQNYIENFYFFTDLNGNLLQFNNIFYSGQFPIVVEKYPKFNFEKANLFYISGKNFVIENKKDSITIPVRDFKNYIQQGILQKRIALTFDDGPNENTNKILDVLKKHNAKATFFVLGSNIKEHKEELLRIHNEGHEIGNHSFNHPDLKTLKYNEVKQEIISTNNLIFSFTNKTPNLVRPPYGSFNENTKKIFNDLNMHISLWNIDTLDWQSKNPKKISSNIIKEAKEDKVILMHDIYQTSALGLDQALTQLTKLGYTFVPYSGLY